jgi:hypothetical protein
VEGRSALAEGFQGAEPSDGRFSAPFDEMLAARDASLERQLELFGEGGWDVYGAGADEGLLGRPEEELQEILAGTPSSGSPPSGIATIDATGSRLLRSLGRRSPVTPVAARRDALRSAEG